MSVYQSAPTPEQAAITAKDFNFWYGDFHALTGLDLNIAKKRHHLVYRSFGLW